MVKQKRVRACRAIVTALAAGLWLAPAPRARAHPETSPQLVNRYLTVIANGDRLEFFVSMLYGEGPGIEERRRMDSDGDGQLAPPELAAARERWMRLAPELAAITVDGQPLALGEATVDLQLGKEVGVERAPLALEIYGSRPLPPGTHTVRLEPGRDPPRLGETELVLDLTPDWEIVSSHRARDPAGTQNRFRLEGPRTSSLEDRSATFVIRSAPERAGGRSRALIVGLAGGAVLLAAAAALVGRKRASR